MTGWTWCLVSGSLSNGFWELLVFEEIWGTKWFGFKFSVSWGFVCELCDGQNFGDGFKFWRFRTYHHALSTPLTVITNGPQNW